MQRGFLILAKRLWTWALLSCLCVGCTGRARTANDYRPNATIARDSLSAVLTAWKNGAPIGKVENVSPTVQAVDFQWNAGQRLQRFEILNEIPGDGPVRFSVQLVLDDSGTTQDAQYVVLGIDPLWVFRAEDFAKVAAMDHDHSSN